VALARPLFGEQTMSRAMNIDAKQADVIETCAKLKTPISAIEPLISGGTRVVLMNGDDAEIVRKAYKSKLLLGAVTRNRWVRNV
jgi:hypothetical protein